MAARRPCIEAGCPEITQRTRCSVHESVYQRRRNATPKRRAYLDPEYRAQPKHGTCWICGEPGADTRDHVTPIAVQMAQWGEVRDHRTQPAHRSCNSGRGAGEISATRGGP